MIYTLSDKEKDFLFRLTSSGSYDEFKSVIDKLSLNGGYSEAKIVLTHYNYTNSIDEKKYILQKLKYFNDKNYIFHFLTNILLESRYLETAILKAVYKTDNLYFSNLLFSLLKSSKSSNKKLLILNFNLK